MKRHKAITFQSNEANERAKILKRTQNNYWKRDDVEFLVDMYANAEKRHEKILNGIDDLDRKISSRLVKDKIR